MTNPVVNGAPQTITIEYTTIVANVQSNQSGTTLTNDNTFQTGSSLVEISADPLNVVTPRLTLTKTASPTVGDSNGTPIKFTIVIRA